MQEYLQVWDFNAGRQCHLLRVEKGLEKEKKEEEEKEEGEKGKKEMMLL